MFLRFKRIPVRTESIRQQNLEPFVKTSILRQAMAGTAVQHTHMSISGLHDSAKVSKKFAKKAQRGHTKRFELGSNNQEDKMKAKL